MEIAAEWKTCIGAVILLAIMGLPFSLKLAGKLMIIVEELLAAWDKGR